jgi:hypothetical protein
MVDENEVCEEVTALLDRMDKFPEEFLDDYRLDQKWGRIVRVIGDDNNNKDVFTSAELRLLQEKIKGLTRVRMKREILETIMRVETENQYVELPNNIPTGRLQRAVPISNGGAVNAVWSSPYPDKIKKMEEDNRIELEKIRRELAKETIKPKPTGKY